MANNSIPLKSEKLSISEAKKRKEMKCGNKHRKSEMTKSDKWSDKNEHIASVRRGHRELLDGRLCRPDSEQRPLVSNFTNVAVVKLGCHNFTKIANFMIFFVSTISFRPTDLSLLNKFSKNVD